MLHSRRYAFVVAGVSLFTLVFTVYMYQVGTDQRIKRVSRRIDRSDLYERSAWEEFISDQSVSVSQSLEEEETMPGDSNEIKQPASDMDYGKETPVQKEELFQRIVYNRVGKCGSRSMLSLISTLATPNGFNFYSSPISNFSKPYFMDLLQEVKIIGDLQPPYIYSRHIHYIDFAKFGMTPPVYINMIRDPIERFNSQYHFQRYGDGTKAQGRRALPWRNGEKMMDINDCILTNHTTCSVEKTFYIIPYFCGQDPACQRPSDMSLSLAKLHVMQNYLFVGYLEDFKGMLQVLEKSLPSHFKGALETWEAGNLKYKKRLTSTLQKRAINSTAYRVLKQRMKMEYDFYNFVKLRFSIIKKQLGFSNSDSER